MRLGNGLGVTGGLRQLQRFPDQLEGLVGGPRYDRPLIADGAEVEPTATVGRLAVIGPGASVATGAAVERSVLHAGASVGADAKVEDSILGPGCEIGPGALVREAVLGDRARVAAGARVEGDRVPPGTAVD
jgi:mannose-1-phosphate guanylyltransferase